ncbi:MAG: HD domain-containing protein [Gammaproteobacteria bacterium]|nr:HD domain-containing protein [Gammaproteobacteria bacterium]MDH4256116.1 HD domain-containing protein [Gammaproteobacteria bacterium]MDH5310469.1 HD domain-containing protein [Gammaproteobacteria bacterium]
MSRKVAFTEMQFGTQADYDLLFEDEARKSGEFAERVLGWLRDLDCESPYQISRFQHSLQTATRAERDGADDETIVCALLHDIGDIIAPANHSQVAAAVLAPYVSDRNHWIVKHHGIFQGYYWFHFAGGDRNARDRYRDHPCYEACAHFCARWDQPSFDPGYETFPLEHFAPRVRELFAREPRPFF